MILPEPCDIGKLVIYRNKEGQSAPGVIRAIRPAYIFVDYSESGRGHSAATLREDLYWPNEEDKK